MPHIDLGVDGKLFPGITGLAQYRPETARPLLELTEVLLRKPNSLTRGERELIASYVATLDDCRFCASSHAAVAAAELEAGLAPVQPDGAFMSDKLRALLLVAGAVQQGGKRVTTELVEAARAAGASDLEIHDTVLIAAACCMYSRYVDGLATFAPDDPAVYAARAHRIVNFGYVAVRPGQPTE